MAESWPKGRAFVQAAHCRPTFGFLHLKTVMWKKIHEEGLIKPPYRPHQSWGLCLPLILCHYIAGLRVFFTFFLTLYFLTFSSRDYALLPQVGGEKEPIELYRRKKKKILLSLWKSIHRTQWWQEGGLGIPLRVKVGLRSPTAWVQSDSTTGCTLDVGQNNLLLALYICTMEIRVPTQRMVLRIK